MERFTDKNNLCILNNGSPTYLKPQAQHSHNPTSAIELSTCTPDLALRCTWEVLPDTHGSDHYPVLISVPPTSADTDQGGDSNHWVFPKADWERFAESCMDKITGHILQDQDPLISFVELVISAVKDSIPRATIVPKKSNPWFDEECREMLRARRALDRKVHRKGGSEQGHSCPSDELRHRPNDYLLGKKESRGQNMSQSLNPNTPIKHVWDRVRKISGKNVCPPKRYLNGKDGASITDPKSIANEHAAAFTDNSSSAHYSARFQAIKEQDEKVQIDFTSDNTEVYNKPFRLRDLRRSILKAKPRAPGPDGIYNNLLKHLPEDTMKILKDILNDIWTKGDFPHQWRAATVIPIPKPNKDNADPNSYRPIALTSCLCKILERMINTRLIWYLEKSGILDRSQCGFRKYRSIVDHLVSLERYIPGCLCTETTGGWSLLRPGEGLWNNLAVWYHQRPAQDRPQRPIACLCSRVSSRPPNSSQNRHHILWWILPGRCPNWWCIGCYMYWAKDQRSAVSYRQGYLQSTLCWWPGDLFSWPLPGHHRETFAAGS